MKMQNVLRAKRDGIVKKIHAAAGATLAVDALILEFALVVIASHGSRVCAPDGKLRREQSIAPRRWIASSLRSLASNASRLSQSNDGGQPPEFRISP